MSLNTSGDEQPRGAERGLEEPEGAGRSREEPGGAGRSREEPSGTTRNERPNGNVTRSKAFYCIETMENPIVIEDTCLRLQVRQGGSREGVWE